MSKYNVELTKWEIGNVVAGLELVIARRMKNLRAAQRRSAAGAKSVAGAVASRAVELADLRSLQDRLVRVVTDAEQEQRDGDAAQCQHSEGCPTYDGGHCTCEFSVSPE